MASFLRRGVGWRLGIGLADSAVSSAGNFGVSIVAARSTSLSEFGIFATATLVLLLVTLAFRSAHGEALVLKRSTIDPWANAVDERRSITSILTLSSVVGLAAIGSGSAAQLVHGRGFDSAALTVVLGGSALPLLCLQDHLRYIEYARHTSHRALINDLLWTLVSVGSMIVAHFAFEGAIPAYVCVMIWAYSTIPGILYALACGHIRLAFRGRPHWLGANRTLITPLVMDFFLTQATAQGATLVVAGLAGTIEMAFIRKAQIWLGPATVATQGILVALQPILSQRSARRGARAAVRLAAMVGAVATIALLLCGVVVLLLPTEIAEVLVGSGWAGARRFVGPLTVLGAAGMIGGCLGLALRTTGLIARQVRWRMVLGPASVALVAIVTEVEGARAGMWCLAATAAFTAVAWAALLFLARTGSGRRDACGAPRRRSRLS